VGDVVLLGRRATETKLLSALAKRARWRAVHFACHGLVDTQHPQLSSLALTPDSQTDGFLTLLSVCRATIPADLVVLSACETAKGKIHRAEGIVGFTRAFMLAGASRVLCSLWKVDDAATQALMRKFYELWNPRPPSTSARKTKSQGTKSTKPVAQPKPLGAAQALQQAQAFVRSHKKWKEPHYWAAWVLWGLPD
jgi:CHAT domain-containing protein